MVFLSSTRVKLESSTSSTSFYLSFLDPVAAFNLNIVICFFLIGFFSFQYLKLIKLHPFAALFSSLSFTFSFYLVTQISHYDILQAISFLPLLLYLLQKFILSTQKKYLVFFSLTLSQQVFCGFPQLVFISLLFLAPYSLYFLRKQTKDKQNLIKHTFLFFFSIILGITLAAIQLLPSRNFLAISNRKDGLSYEASTAFSYPPKHLATLIKPFLLGNPAKGTYPSFKDFDGSIFWENTAYFGLIALIFSLASLIFIKKNKYIRFFWFTTIAFFLLMSGKYSPLYFIFSFFPFNLFRVPSRFILVFVFSLAILSGLFLNELIKKSKQYKYLLIAFASLCLIINLLDLFRLGYTYHPTVPKNDVLKKLETVKFLSSFQENKIFSFALAETWNNIFLKEGWQHPSKFIFLNNSLDANINLLWNIPSFNVYKILVTQKYQILNALINANFSKPQSSPEWQISDLGIKLLKQNGINFIVCSEKIKESVDLKLVFQTSNKNEPCFYIYKLKNALPFTWFAHKVEVVKTLKEFNLKLNDPSFNFNTTILATQKLPNSSDSVKENKIKILKKESELLEFYIESKESSYFVMQQAYLPGWKAYLDKKSVEVNPVNLIQIAVLIPPGKHRLKLSYLPKDFHLGVIISLSSLLAILSFLFF